MFLYLYSILTLAVGWWIIKMREKIIVCLVLILFLVGLMGCTELQGIETGQVNGGETAELLSYEISSWTWMDERVSQGFDHAERVDYYCIQGTIKNKLDHTANIVVALNFYDAENNFLGSEDFRILNLPSSETHSFTRNLNKNTNRFSTYWDQIEKVTFDFTEL